MKNVDSTDKEFLEEVDLEEKNIEEQGYRAGRKVENEMNNRPPTFYKDNFKNGRITTRKVFDLAVSSNQEINRNYLSRKKFEISKEFVDRNLVTNQAAVSVSAVRDLAMMMKQMPQSVRSNESGVSSTIRLQRRVSLLKTILKHLARLSRLSAFQKTVEILQAALSKWQASQSKARLS